MADDPIRCLEFFSGIGGLHYALKIANLNAEVIRAFDVNSIANKVYEYNFGLAPSNKTIDQLSIKDIDSCRAECWLLSPPCQPYTTGGRQLDIEDNRAKPLLHLIDLLPKLTVHPDYIFLENVKNFESSQSRDLLLEQLEILGYEVKEFLLSPIQFGIPNHRLRYYLTARRRNKRKEGDAKADSWPQRSSTIIRAWPPDQKSTNTELKPREEIGLDYFLEKDENAVKKSLVPEKYILRLYHFRLDIVRPSSTSTSCITKAYGSHHIQTSGSLVQTKRLEDTDYDWGDTQSLLSFGLRFLTPTEISRLHAFPGPEYQLHDLLRFEDSKGPLTNSYDQKDDYDPFIPPTCKPYLEFPDEVTRIQRYRLLGNSLNCWVVAELYKKMLFL
ncbi:S-adenosyl-L-methionine-dependent methyltransferase [Mycotypha africana]|uniref:S-adenosyl-L-methionine-dependent methyltransferase n=1 Tax=Mycotypha africana TaxID=64632 RepID=UPI0023011991|nr:S-adenosyl-L-methionine-dependent methyltransferase [Mycotypha africana]KAI8967943.1 S-adenosyl-L-methionine-dependent methyltransferase [Mycotypha africana]